MVVDLARIHEGEVGDVLHPRATGDVLCLRATSIVRHIRVAVGTDIARGLSRRYEGERRAYAEVVTAACAIPLSS